MDGSVAHQSLPAPQAPSDQAPNKFVYYARKVYRPLGFRRGYNFPLWVIGTGAYVGFALARFMYLNFHGHFLPKAYPGDQYYLRHTDRHVGVMLHMVGLLPAIFLVGLQFVPIIRYKKMIIHRLNGYLCLLLLLIGNIGGFMMVRVAVGGLPDTQLYFGGLTAMVTVAAFLAWINIKMLQIDQHRAWMIRAWAWLAVAISNRLLMMPAKDTIIAWYTYYTAISCREISFMFGYYNNLTGADDPTTKLYPVCVDPSAFAAVSTRDTAGHHGIDNKASLARITFVTTGWLALLLHVALTELYLALTPAEAERLRKISYERQAKAGYRFASKGGLTASRLGDAPPGWNGPAPEPPLSEKQFLDESGSDSDVNRDSNTPKYDGQQSV